MSRIIRASELGSFSYCHRAWMYHRQGLQSTNQNFLDSGINYHEFHSSSAKKIITLQKVALVLTVLGGILIVIHFLAIFLK